VRPRRQLVYECMLLALLCTLSAAARAQEVPPAGVAAREKPVTRVEILLTGGKGRAAPEPQREDLRLFVDGIERPILHFEKEVLPVSYGLVVDNSGSLKTQIRQVVAAARFVVEKNRPGDEAFVVRFVSSDNIKVLQTMTADVPALKASFDSMAVEGGQTALLDALYLAGDYLIKSASRTAPPKRRRALLLVTDGEDRNSFYKVEQVLKLLKAGGVRVFCIGLTGTLDDMRGLISQSKRETARELLRKIAAETGGRVFYAEKGGELEEAVGEVVENLRVQYVLGFEPAPATGGKSRGRVEVKVVGAPGKAGLKAQPVAPAAKGR